MTPLERRPPDWWDDLAVSAAIADPFNYLASVAPLPEQHDYVLYTDGSGHRQGFGASAAIAKCSATEEHVIRISGNYGSTVQRNELSALLDGLHAIADHQLRRVSQLGLREIPALNAWNAFLGDDRITVMWYTDRQNLALSLLFDENARPLNKRHSERDLWMRFSAMAKHFCITPLQVPRNVIPCQAVCDDLCTIARDAMSGVLAGMQAVIPINIYNEKQWLQPKPQNALM